MPIVHVVQHSRKMVNGNEDIKFIGVFSSEDAARAAIDDLSSQSGFRDYLDGFAIDQYEMDATHWREGFVGD